MSKICSFWSGPRGCSKGPCCKFRHIGPEKGDRVSPPPPGVGKTSSCNEWDRDGFCRFGDKCRFRHDGAKKTPETAQASSSDSHRFAKVLISTQKERLSDTIKISLQEWNKVWEDAPLSFNLSLLKQLVILLATLPFSADVSPPPILPCRLTLEKFMDMSCKISGADSRTIAQSVEIILNVVTRLLKFEWNMDREEVRSHIMKLLEDSIKCLQLQVPDHMILMKKIMDEYVKEVQKPWSIKEKAVGFAGGSGQEAIEDTEQSYTDWRKATVSWLANPQFFTPSALPVMKVPDPNSKSCGVYESKDRYLETIERLWVAMTFSDGCGALTPKCSQKECGKELWPIGNKGGCTSLACRTHRCCGEAALACSMKRGHDALCAQCTQQVKGKLLGGPGTRASTHIYDAVVRLIDADGRMYVQSFASRHPPQREIHWRSTRRLATACLVGVVRLASAGATLRSLDRVWWGEIILHGELRAEEGRRKRGDLAINMLSVDSAFDVGSISPGDFVAIIDCQTFVPEFVPVLRALEQQKLATLPFDDGSLLNLNAGHAADLSYLQPVASENCNIRVLVQEMIQTSRLTPIVEIRRDPDVCSVLNDRLCALVQQTSLDRTQLSSFVDAIRSPVHLTQGPPGTGKSYLGVVIVRALLVVRSLWMRVNPSAGTPPILVISYKNHAIDEFLVDLLKAEPYSLRNSLIRTGRMCSDPRLQPYSEKTASNSDHGVKLCRDRINDLHVLISTCKALCESCASFLSYRIEMFEQQGDPDDEFVQRRTKAGHEATEVILGSMARSKFLSKSISEAKDTSGPIDLDFFSKDGADIRSLRLQRRVGKNETLLQIETLFKGVEHLQIDEPAELIHMWICGIEPLPLCNFVLLDNSVCPELAVSKVGFCAKHQCRAGCQDGSACSNPVKVGKSLCISHACEEEACTRIRLGAPQVYCSKHVCFKCMKDGRVSCLAVDEPPRNVCEDHPLCCVALCLELSLKDLDYCGKHSKTTCVGVTKAGRQCLSRAISRNCPYCQDHEHQFLRKMPVNREREQLDSDSSSSEDQVEELPKRCIGITVKKQPCKGWAALGSSYCHNHRSQDSKNTKFVVHKTVDTGRQSEAELKQIHTTVDVPVTKSQVKHEAKSESQNVAQGAQNVNTTQIIHSEERIIRNGADNTEDGSATSSSDFDSAQSELDEMDAPGPVERDELELNEQLEADHEQHLREIFELNGHEDSEEEEDTQIGDSFKYASNADAEAQTGQNLLGKVSAETFAVYSDPRRWHWKMSLDERWEACRILMECERNLLSESMMLLSEELKIVRKDLHTAKIRASAKIYENRAVIGGTVVGCITRLEAIRSTNPFAVLVEEASEVLEPLLFSCLCSSTCKLEMIGDHLQLQPSIMSKYFFERINKVHVSMFERLIRAPPGHEVPSSVLSVQRRMRTNICDFIRNYYSDIVMIEDHAVTSNRVVPGDIASRSFSKGREIPGMRSHIFMWTHSGDQQLAQVGLSKINPHEAKMTCKLAEYLVACGVPKTSIAILTPYKGQLLLIRSNLLKYSKAKLLSADPKDTNVCRLSTVDRFQGDESDVVIISLVVDSKSNSQFVMLQNRMIVLLSRARLGMFIISNAGYFESRESKGSVAKHWEAAFKMLQLPAPSDSAPSVCGPSDTYNGIRVGPKISICCPQHPQSTLEVSDPEHLKLGFCKSSCMTLLRCTHPCNLPCHWPTDSHKTECTSPVRSPCSRHSEDVPCSSIFANSQVSSKRPTIFEAMQSYRCPATVNVMQPCGHEAQMKCADECDILSGISAWPRCDRPAHQPYVYPLCKHYLSCSCFNHGEYVLDSSKATKCREMVEFFPPCGHSKTVPCYLKVQFEAGITAFVCQKRVSIHLPRCGHLAEMSCAEEITLRSWTGTRCAEIGLVLEGEDYGPADFSCTEVVQFVRFCSHRSAVRCSQAFDMARVAVECSERVDAINPHCGHMCSVTCLQQKQLKTMQTNVPIDIVREGLIVPRNPLLISIQCTKKVILERKCGHKQEISCSDANGILPKCFTEVALKSPICSHTIRLQCFASSFDGWKFWEHDVWDSLNVSGTLPQNWWKQPGVVAGFAVPQHWDHLLKACSGTTAVTRVCGHLTTAKCTDLIDIIRNGDLRSKCVSQVSVVLECGHTMKTECWKCQNGLPKQICQEVVDKKCWNFQVCGKLLKHKCSSQSTLGCDSVTEWSCPAGKHKYMLRQCTEGTPQDCPLCGIETLVQTIQDIKEFMDVKEQLRHPLLIGIEVFDKSQVININISAMETERFYEAQEMLLTRFKKRTENQSISDTQLFSPRIITCFIVLNNSTRSASSFSPSRFMRANTLNGVKVHEWSQQNIQLLAQHDLLQSESSSLDLLVGYGYSVNAIVDPRLPAAKQLKKKVNVWHEEGFDCVSFVSEGYRSIVFWDPFPLIATHKIRATKTDLLRLNIALSERVCQESASELLPKRVNFTKPPAHLEVVKIYSDLSTKSSNKYSARLRGTCIEDLQIDTDWNGKGFICPSNVISKSTEMELMRKLAFVNPDAEVFAGKQILDNSKSLPTPFRDLLLALECHALDDHPADSNSHLERYLAAIRQSSGVAHPLTLVALARLSSFTDLSSDLLFAIFEEMFPAAIDIWLSSDERVLISESHVGSRDGISLGLSSPVVQAAVNAKTMWEELKAVNSCCRSESMEKLLALTGLKKVKVAAVNLFKTALKFQRSSAEFRSANPMALNYCFLGNPGTGKTTVARLFAGILHDSQMRRKNVFVECTSQGVKDEGIDNFRKVCTSAMDGVLFIDEAYDLDPTADHKGRPIVNELLTLSENKRDRISIILAGYEDDMNSKLFSYNTGLKSRFDEVMFEDFDEKELTAIWSQMLTDRKWKEASPKLTEISIRRLVKMTNRKGFGNARAVRKMLEGATRSAMSRDDYDDLHPTLEIVDIIGEDPSINPKLNGILEELDSRIGWAKIKKAVRELVSLCSDNYHRELRGEAPIQPFLNRLFLGNPGTGKTTCAAIYGRVLKYLNFLSNGDIVSKTAGDFGGSFVGEAQKKTLSIIEGARGKVLVIDEAYSLDDGLYGKVVLDTLVEKVQGCENDDIAVLLLGYEEPMLKMIRKQNPGLQRRFPREQAFVFDDYSDKEMVAIMKAICLEKNVDISLNFQQKALKILTKQKHLSNFGNAGTVNLLVQKAIQKAMLRNASSSAKILLKEVDIDDPSLAEGVLDPLATLDSLYRMEAVKIEVQRIKNSFVVAEREGGSTPDLGHFVFCGSPGTGKTTVARVIASLLFNLGLLTVNKLVETSGLGLTGKFVGETKTIVKDKLDEAKGGVLFIDEAYELGKGSYGTEACTSLVEAMTDPQYKGIVIIIAGYSREIDGMLDTNPGLKSRFTRFLNFADWEKDDCVDFIRSKANKESFDLSLACTEALQTGFSGLISRPGWANGRDVCKLWGSILEYRAKRVINAPENEKAITLEDISDALSNMLVARGGDVFNCNSSLEDPMTPINRLYRMEMVKYKLEMMRDTHMVAKREGGNAPKLGHFVFTGSPGTGKTTVARVVAKVLYDLGLVSVNKLVETSDLKLTGEFIGHTKKKVEQQLVDAKGGVLFIDEAYELGKGHFSDEACTSIVAAMTDPKYADTVIIIAGYPAEINSMLDTNAGLKSRFTEHFEFPDWNASDAVHFFIGKAEKEGFSIPEHKDVSSLLELCFSQLIEFPGWGNCRDVERLWKDVSSFRAKRVVDAPEENRTIALIDVKPAVHSMIKTRSFDVNHPAHQNKQVLGRHYARFVPQDAADSPTAYCPLTSEPMADNVSQLCMAESLVQEKNKNSKEAENLADPIIAEVIEQSTVSTENCHSKSSDASDSDDYSIAVCQDGRDKGVEDADWILLQHSKIKFVKLETTVAEFEQMEEEIKVQEREAERVHDERVLKIKREINEQRRLDELCKIEKLRLKRIQQENFARSERKRAQEQKQNALRKAQEIREKIRVLCQCPQGYNWFQVPNGWRCVGGSHFVSDSQLENQFTNAL